MNKINSILVAITCLLLICSWTSKKSYSLKKAKWILGTWENKTSRGSIYENWTSTNRHEFSGKSYMLNQKDTMIFENIKLVQKEDSLFYIPIVINQNSGLPVRFGATKISKTT